MTSPNPLNPLAHRPHDALPGHNPGTGAGTLHPAALRPAPGAEPATDRVPQVVRASRPGALSPYAQAVGDFSAAPLSHGGDALDLRELLRDQPKGIGRDPGALARHLAIDTASSPGSTLLRLSRAGAFEPEGRTAQEEERLVLAGVDLRAAMGFGPAASDAQVIAELLARGKLLA